LNVVRNINQPKCEYLFILSREIPFPKYHEKSLAIPILTDYNKTEIQLCFKSKMSQTIRDSTSALSSERSKRELLDGFFNKYLRVAQNKGGFMRGKCYWSVALLLFLCLAAVQVVAQESQNVSCINRLYHSWGDGVYDLAFRGYYGYLACGSDGLRIVGNPYRLDPGLSDFGQYQTTFANAIAISGNYAYLGDSHDGLYIIDFSNPLTPQLLLQIPFSSVYFNAIRIEGNYAFLCTYPNGLMIYDISDSASAHFVWSSVNATDVRDVDVQGNMAYLACAYNDFQVYDISDINSPQFINSYSCQDGEWVIGAAVSGGYAFLACGGDGFRVIDLANMQMVASIDSLHYGFRVKVVGNYAYTTYGDPECPLAIIDITNPLVPQTLGIYYPPEDLINFQVIDSQIFAADFHHGIRQIEIGDPTRPFESARYNRFGHDLDVVISGECAYIKSEYGLTPIDIADPRNPTESNSYETAWEYNDLKIIGNLAYIAQDYDTAFRVIGLSRPPQLLGSFLDQNSGGHERVAIYGNYAYLLEPGGLRIIDVTNPQNLQQVAYYTHDFFNAEMAVFDNYLILQDRDLNLLIFDVSTPTYPVLAGAWPLNDNCRDMKAADGWLYLLTDHKFWIFNLASFDPWTPSTEMTLIANPNSSLYSIDVSDNFAFITGDSIGLCVYDISQRTAPLLTGYSRLPVNPRGVAVIGHTAIVADYSNLGFYDCSAATGIKQYESPTPGSFALLPNYPNPFNSSTQIRFELPKQDHVTLTIYDILGRNVATLAAGEFNAGQHIVLWNGTDANGDGVASGRYYIKAKAGDAVQRLPVMLLK
jgi:hypothetical protein